ncbi:MAG TPA: pentapeptide repeat-containing protein, partial [Candidatus Nanopelagicales bacterium]|nr:pentapeptide repeat-containing protein [Candidatus Nanopelagicales bacterium]
DFGTGKTFLLHELARRMGRAGGPVVPVLIEMRALEKARTLDALLAQHFALSGVSLIDLAAFDYLLKNGRIALLFDGFDELALRVTYDRAAEHFETLVGAVRGRAKIVATSRTQHFLNDQQIRTALGARAEQIPGARMVKLLPFTEPQIRRFLVNRLLSEERAEARLRLIADVKDLLGLAENPRMLSFIAQIEDDELLEAQRRDGQITAAGLYRLLLERWIGLEFERAHPRGALSGLTEEQRWHAITELASRLWLRTEGAIDLLDLPSELVEAIQALGPEPIHPGEVTHQIGTGTLLVRDEQGRFSFIHQSVLEWLVANAAADEVQRTGRSAALAAREMSLLMTDFFCDLAGREAATAWASRTLGEGDSEIAVRNALQVQHLLGIEVSHRLDLAGKGLRGQDLSGRDLRGANLQGADLSAARLVGADLEGANLRGARLAWADLSRARLAGADLSAADLTNARLLGADLRGAKLAGVRARNAALVGATLDEGALDKVNVFGAALPHPERIGVRLAASPPTCNDLAASSDGSLFASAHGDGAVRLWNAETGRCIRLFRIDQGIALSVAMRADGSMLAAGYANGSIRLWSIPSGAEVAHLTARRRPVRSIAFSPNGRSLAFVSVDGGVDLWNMRSGKRLRPVADQVDAACVAFSPDGRTLAFDVRKTVRLWNVASGTERPSLQDHRRIVWSFGFSPDGQWLAACSTDGIRLWHVASGRVQQVFRRPDRFRSLAFSSLAFSSDSKTLATGTDDSTILLWDLDTGVERHVLRGREGPVRAVAFSAGGAILASASEAGIIRLWSPITGEHLATLLAAPEGWAAVLPDGRYKLGGDSAGTFRHAINGVHFAPGQLDPYIPGLRLPDDEPLLLPRPPLLRGG